MTEWWLPYAVIAAALVVSLIGVAPRRVRERGRGAPSRRSQSAGDRAPRRERREREDDLDRPARAQPSPPRTNGSSRHEPVQRVTPLQPAAAPAAKASPPARPTPPPAPVRPRAAPLAAATYARDPAELDDWPQADAVREALEAFLDRWGVEDAAAAAFRRVEPISAGNGGQGERAFVFVLDAKLHAGSSPLLIRVCAPDADDRPPTRLWVTSYFDHIGERFREDVAKTPQHSRRVILVRDVPPDENGKSAVALDYEAGLTGEIYDDVRAEDVGQYKNLLNIMRMFA